MRVDAHQHYWVIGRGDYGWLQPSSGILHQDYMPEQLEPWLSECNVAKTIVVQAAPTIAETHFLLDLCEKEASLAGVVGWLDLEADDFEEQLLLLKGNKYFLGVRPSFPGMDQADVPIATRVIRSLRMLGDHHLTLDLLVGSLELPFVLQLLKELPELKAVVNHLANPDYTGQAKEPWMTAMQQIAEYPNIYCKLSGMINRVSGREASVQDFTPYVHHAVNVFGIDRVMFGSDWPVCLETSTYEETVELLEKALPSSLSEEERARVFGGNAAAFYGLD